MLSKFSKFSKDAPRVPLAAALAFYFLAACVVENGKPTPTPAPNTPPPAAEPATPADPATPTDPPVASCPEASASVTYTSKDPAVCARALFKCEPGQRGFSDKCGCGCIGEASGGASCPDEAAPGVDYKSKDGGKCAAMRFACPSGAKPFSSAECGCGCEPAAAGKKAECPDEASALITYKSKSADECARMRFTCAATEKAFSSGECGCGCEPDVSKTPREPPVAAKCPEASVAGVDYKSKDTSFCARARIACPKGKKPFGSECGCGCVPL